jgi:hypothetical protein
VLKWLQTNNSIYHDIVIDPTQLHDLPQNYVPQQLLVIVQWKEDDEVAMTEHELYVVNEEKTVLMREDNVEDERNFKLSLRGEIKTINLYIGEAQVIPIHFLDVQDCDQARLSTNEVLLYALANADNRRYGHEGGYAVIHSAQAVPDLPGASKLFDVLAATYPVLWPYGCGLFHEEHPQKMSFSKYIHWTLQYFDK